MKTTPAHHIEREGKTKRERERKRINSRRYSMNRRRNNSGRMRRNRRRSSKSNPPFKLICIIVYIYSSVLHFVSYHNLQHQPANIQYIPWLLQRHHQHQLQQHPFSHTYKHTYTHATNKSYIGMYRYRCTRGLYFILCVCVCVCFSSFVCVWVCMLAMCVCIGNNLYWYSCYVLCVPLSWRPPQSLSSPIASYLILNHFHSHHLWKCAWSFC